MVSVSHVRPLWWVTVLHTKALHFHQNPQACEKRSFFFKFTFIKALACFAAGLLRDISAAAAALQASVTSKLQKSTRTQTVVAVVLIKTDPQSRMHLE